MGQKPSSDYSQVDSGGNVVSKGAGKSPLMEARKAGKRGCNVVLLAYLGACVVMALLRAAVPQLVSTTTSRAGFYTLTVALVAGWLLLVPKIPAREGSEDDPDDYADTRTLCCRVPNTNDVLSNIPLSIAGVWGLWLLRPGSVAAEMLLNEAELWCWRLTNFFLVFSGPASAWYHLWPIHRRLAADRCPIACMAVTFVVGLVTSREDLQLWVCGVALFAANAFGVYSVHRFLYARQCRWYYFAQYGMLSIAIGAVLLFPHQSCPWGAPLGILTYIFAKVLEDTDHQVFRLLCGTVSGHTIKHVVAAGAGVLVNVAVGLHGSI